MKQHAQKDAHSRGLAAGGLHVGASRQIHQHNEIGYEDLGNEGRQALAGFRHPHGRGEPLSQVALEVIDYLRGYGASMSHAHAGP